MNEKIITALGRKRIEVETTRRFPHESYEELRVKLGLDTSVGIASYCNNNDRFDIFPREGDVFNFDENIFSSALVCGRKYMSNNGSSQPVEVAGKKIKIKKVVAGDMWNLAEISFEIL